MASKVTAMTVSGPKSVSEWVAFIREEVRTRRHVVDVALKDVNRTFFVRNALNDEHSLQLGLMMEGGTKLDPGVITQNSREMVDGRHRFDAHEMNQKTTMEFVEIPDLDRVTLIAIAIALNAGSSLPPTKEDIQHTIQLYIENEVPLRKIAELLPFPASVVRKYVTDVQQRMKRARLVRAARAVRDGGQTVSEAAKENDVHEADLKEHLGGKKAGRKQSESADILRTFSTRFNSFGRSNSALMRRAFDLHEDGEIPLKELKRIVGHHRQLADKMLKRAVENEDRVEAKAKAKSAE